MDHTQTVWLAHSLSLSVAFWLWCVYQSFKQKKALRRLQRLRADKKLFNHIISQIS